jgi:nucleoside-diphosphate-sugar epimerase
VLDAAASVGWAPEITLDELIDETALYYRVRDDAREAHAVPLDPGVRV